MKVLALLLFPALMATAGSAVAPVLEIGAMAAARAVHQATVLDDGRVLITGGCSGRCDEHLALVERFDPATRRFETLAPLLSARDSHVALSLGAGRVLVAGGWSGRRATASAELFDPAAQRFVELGPLQQARAMPSAVKLADGRVLISGGQDSDLQPLSSAELFDPAARRFLPLAAMGRARAGHSMTLLDDGRVLVVGGRVARRGAVLRSAELFDPASGRFTPAGELRLPREKHAAVRLLDGRVLIVGGSDVGPRSQRHRSTEIYDPASGRFVAGPEMRWPRYKLPDAVVRLPSGAVLVAGGAAQPELFEPRSGRFVALDGELRGALEFATASLLPDGQVLVLGGYDEEIRSSAAAWLLRAPALTPVAQAAARR